MKLFWGIVLCFLLYDSGFAMRTKKLPPGIDPLSYEKQGPEDQFAPRFFKWVGKNKNLFADVFFDYMSVPKDSRSFVLDSITSPQSQDTRCDGCIVSFLTFCTESVCNRQNKKDVIF